jgi:predicted PurR-regulated permease PerM
MQRFAIGVLAGLLLAGAVIIGASGAGGPVSGPLYFTAATSTTTQTSTQTVLSSTTSSSALAPQAGNSTTANQWASDTNMANSLGSLQSSLSGISSGPGGLAGALLRSAVLFLPVLAALFFGLLVYRASAQRERP